MRIAAAQVHPAWLDPTRGTAIVTDYSRPDVLQLTVNRRRLAAVRFED